MAPRESDKASEPTSKASPPAPLSPQAPAKASPPAASPPDDGIKPPMPVTPMPIGMKPPPGAPPAPPPQAPLGVKPPPPAPAGVKPPPPAPASCGPPGIAVNIVSARGIPANGSLAPFCTCQVPGKAESQFKTQAIQGATTPVWDHCQSKAPFFLPGDDLIFSLYSRADDLIGSVTLPSARFWPEGLTEELAVKDDVFVKVAVTALNVNKALLSKGIANISSHDANSSTRGPDPSNDAKKIAGTAPPKQEKQVPDESSFAKKTVAEEAVSGDTCPSGHILQHWYVTQDGYGCDICLTEVKTGGELWGCRRCEYDKCRKCLKQAPAGPPKTISKAIPEKPQPATEATEGSARDTSQTWLNLADRLLRQTSRREAERCKADWDAVARKVIPPKVGNPSAPQSKATS